MLKLKKNVIDFLKANVKPEHVDGLVAYLEREIKYCPIVTCSIVAADSLFDKRFEFKVYTGDFYEVEELKPYVRYPAHGFDGNPNKYWVIEENCWGSPVLRHSECEIDHLCTGSPYFMYIEPFEEK